MKENSMGESIHGVLEYGSIVAHDEDYNILITVNGAYLNLWVFRPVHSEDRNAWDNSDCRALSADEIEGPWTEMGKALKLFEEGIEMIIPSWKVTDGFRARLAFVLNELRFVLQHITPQGLYNLPILVAEEKAKDWIKDLTASCAACGESLEGRDYVSYEEWMEEYEDVEDQYFEFGDNRYCAERLCLVDASMEEQELPDMTEWVWE